MYTDTFGQYFLVQLVDGGMLLVIVVLMIFLGNFRGSLVVAITIPIALLIAFVLMKLTGIPANLL